MAAGNGPARVAGRFGHGDAGGGHPVGAQHHGARLVFRRQADPPRSLLAVGFSEYKAAAYRMGRGDTWNIVRVVLVEHGPLVRARRRILTTIREGVLLGAGGTVFCLMLLGAAGRWRRGGQAVATVEPASATYPYRPPPAWGGTGRAHGWFRPGGGRIGRRIRRPPRTRASSPGSRAASRRSLNSRRARSGSRWTWNCDAAGCGSPGCVWKSPERASGSDAKETGIGQEPTRQSRDDGRGGQTAASLDPVSRTRMGAHRGLCRGARPHGPGVRPVRDACCGRGRGEFGGKLTPLIEKTFRAT